MPGLFDLFKLYQDVSNAIDPPDSPDIIMPGQDRGVGEAQGAVTQAARRKKKTRTNVTGGLSSTPTIGFGSLFPL